VGWPYWAYGWDPWWYNPYWYSPWPSYNYYQNYGDTGYNNPQSYDPYGSNDYDSRAGYSIAPSLNPAALHFDVNVGIGN
jgi:hypothetical protein